MDWQAQLTQIMFAGVAFGVLCVLAAFLLKIVGIMILLGGALGVASFAAALIIGDPATVDWAGLLLWRLAIPGGACLFLYWLLRPSFLIRRITRIWDHDDRRHSLSWFAYRALIAFWFLAIGVGALHGALALGLAVDALFLAVLGPEWFHPMLAFAAGTVVMCAGLIAWFCVLPVRDRQRGRAKAVRATPSHS